ncbi:MAG: CBS domain-containing protein [Steroidobacteraceae bacterium]
MEQPLVVPSLVRSAASLIGRTGANDDTYLDRCDPAFRALTDFRRESLITVEADCSVEDALADMNRLGVHALSVTRQRLEGLGQQVVGLITYHDIERLRAHRHPWAARPGNGGIIRVSDVMTPWNELSLVNYESLQTLTAADVYEMFQGTGLTHLLVIENRGDESVVARGLLSRATLAKRLRHIAGTGSR